MEIIALQNMSTQELENCFTPYKAFLSLYAFTRLCSVSNSREISIYTHSSVSPWRNAFLTSNYCESQSRLIAEAKRILILFILATGANIRCQSTHKFEWIAKPPILLWIFQLSHQLYVSRWRLIYNQPTSCLEVNWQVHILSKLHFSTHNMLLLRINKSFSLILGIDTKVIDKANAL